MTPPTAPTNAPTTARRPPHEPQHRREVSVARDVELTAEVFEDGARVQVRFRAGAGSVTTAARADLVEAVFALPELRRHRDLMASTPIGDAELLTQLRRRCSSFRTRAAGSTCLIEAEIDPRSPV